MIVLLDRDERAHEFRRFDRQVRSALVLSRQQAKTHQKTNRIHRAKYRQGCAKWGTPIIRALTEAAKKELEEKFMESHKGTNNNTIIFHEGSPNPVVTKLNLKKS